jgi:hypothetical protein
MGRDRDSAGADVSFIFASASLEGALGEAVPPLSSFAAPPDTGRVIPASRTNAKIMPHGFRSRFTFLFIFHSSVLYDKIYQAPKTPGNIMVKPKFYFVKKIDKINLFWYTKNTNNQEARNERMFCL